MNFGTKLRTILAIATSLNCVGINAVDYVVEQGTSPNGWTYRKWNSGIAECWGVFVIAVAVTTASAGYGGYRSTSTSVPAFPFTFTGTPTLTAQIGSGSSGCWINNITPTPTGGSFFLSCGGSNASANRAFSFHAIGNWK